MRMRWDTFLYKQSKNQMKCKSVKYYLKQCVVYNIALCLLDDTNAEIGNREYSWFLQRRFSSRSEKFQNRLCGVWDKTVWMSK